MDNYKNQTNVDCSIVVPLYNEANSVNELYERLTKTMGEITQRKILKFQN